jgi:hypothetical protein
MKKFMRALSDWSFRYIEAWWLIFLSPIWFPVWLTIKIKRWEEKVDAEYKETFGD